MSERHILAPVDLREPQVAIGRYRLHRQIARGGMASIHIGRLVGDQGFDRIVAVKRLHSEFAEDGEFVEMFLNEARLASKVKHRNVVPVLDVVTAGDEVMLVQEYVHGAPLHAILKALSQAGAEMPLEIAVAIACQVLSGLHAAHETVDEMGMPLEIVHRDVSPQNVLIATDGSARLLDFGVAKASVAAHVTRSGTYKGKLAYSAPEQIRGAATRQSDVYSLSVVLWEMIVGHRMHRTGIDGSELIEMVLRGTLPTLREGLRARRSAVQVDDARLAAVEGLEQIVARGLAREVHARWATAADMEDALRRVIMPASTSTIAAWLRGSAKEFLERRERLIAAEESSWRKHKTESGPISSVPPQASSVRARAWPDATLELSSDQTDDGSGARRSRTSRDPRVRWGLFSLVVLLLIGLSALLSLRTRRAQIAPRTEAPGAAITAPAATPSPAAVRADSAPPVREQVEEEKPAEDEVAPSHRKIGESRESGSSRSRSRSARTSSPASPSPAPPSVPSAARAEDCSTPYYFEGPKKIFKPACL